MNDAGKNEFFLSGVLKPRTKIEVVTTGPGRFMTKFILVNKQRTKDVKGMVIEYPVTVVGDRREVVEGQGDGRIVVDGYIREGQYGPYCLGVDVCIQEREEFDLNAFTVDGLMFGSPWLRSTDRGPMTDFAVRVYRFSGFQKKFDTVLIPVYGDRIEQMTKMGLHSGHRVIIKGRLAAGTSSPYPRGWTVEVDTESQKWRMSKATKFRFRV